MGRNQECQVESIYAEITKEFETYKDDLLLQLEVFQKTLDSEAWLAKYKARICVRDDL